MYVIPIWNPYRSELDEVLGPYKTKGEAEAILQTLIDEGLNEDSIYDPPVMGLMTGAGYSKKYLLADCDHCGEPTLPGLIAHTDAGGFCEACAAEACPTCGCMSGQGRTEGCVDRMGCGAFTNEQTPKDMNVGRCSCTMATIMATGCKCGGS